MKVLKKSNIPYVFLPRFVVIIKRRTLSEMAFKSPDALEPQPNFDPSRNYLMPLPSTELDVNPNLGPQTPGINTLKQSYKMMQKKRSLKVTAFF